MLLISLHLRSSNICNIATTPCQTGVFAPDPNGSHRRCDNTLRCSPFMYVAVARSGLGQASPAPLPRLFLCLGKYVVITEYDVICGSPSINTRRQILTRSHSAMPAGCFASLETVRLVPLRAGQPSQGTNRWDSGIELLKIAGFPQRNKVPKAQNQGTRRLLGVHFPMATT